MGDPNARTPALDALAAQAANFEQAVTPHPFGPFARAALLTGKPSPENGVEEYFDPLPRGAPTIAQELAARGYHTAFFGKWHLAARDPRAPLVGEAHAKMIVPPADRGGFEYWEGFESGFLLNDPWLHGTRLPEPTLFAGYQSDVLTGRAAAWLEENRTETRPLFCVVSLEAPHPPYAAAADGVAGYDPAQLQLRPNVPRGGDVEAKARQELAGYYAHIEATDRAVGALLARSDDESTVVVFTSAHGDMHGSHGLFRKGWPHEESVRVPLLVRVPDMLRAPAWHGRRDDLVTLLDVTRWTREWSEGGPARLLVHPAQMISMPSVVALPHQCDRVWVGERTRQSKRVSVAGAPWLHFDLERDPYETENRVSPSV